MPKTAPPRSAHSASRRAPTAIAVDVSSEVPSLPLARQRVRTLATMVLQRERVRHAILSVSFVSARRMAALNRRLLSHAGSTDVITLAFRRRSRAEPVVGDVYIAPAVVRENARRASTPAREEFARVVVHAALHVLGYVHPERGRERSAMWRRQEQLLTAARRAGLW